MLRWLIFLASLALVADAPAEWVLGAQREVGRMPGGVVAFERLVSQGNRRVRVSGVSFNAKDAVFRVIDNPPSARVSLNEALRAAGAVAGCNASYFHDDFTPLGLAVSRGQSVHGFERAQLLSGVLTVRKGQIDLVRSTAFAQSSPVEEAVQAGPWLVDNFLPLSGLNAARQARRTAVATDGKGNWAILVTDSITLADAASILALKGLPGSWSIRQALNLDGGSSTALSAFSGTQIFFSIPSFGPVRNYLAIVPRQR